MISWNIQSCGLIGSYLWSIGGQMQRWHHHKQNIVFFYHIKQIDSMLPWVCTPIDYRRHHDVKRRLATHLAATRMPLFCSSNIWLLQSNLFFWLTILWNFCKDIKGSQSHSRRLGMLSTNDYHFNHWKHSSLLVIIGQLHSSSTIYWIWRSRK